MKAAFDVVPLAAFLAVLLIWDIYVATGVLIAALWLSFVLWRLHYGTYRKAHFLLAVLATVLGGLTLYLHNVTFIKWKPTLVYVAFAAVMAGNRLLGRRPLTEAALGEAFDMRVELWRRVEVAWIGFWLACAALNVLVAYSVSDAAWGIYKVVSAFALPLVFMVLQWPFIGRYLKHEKDPEAPPGPPSSAA